MSELITPDIPVQKRNLTQELNAINQANIRFAPQYAALEEQYGPRYNRVSMSNLAESLLGNETTPGQIELNRIGTTEQRTADINDIMRLAPEARDAILNANPWLRAQLDASLARTGDSPLLSKMNTQAEAGLDSGGRLSAQELGNLDQQNRSTFAAHGLVGGPISLAHEILNRDAATRGRMQAAQEYAGGVERLNQGQSGLVNQFTGTAAGALGDQFLQILSRPGQTINPATIGQSGTRAYGPPDLTSYGNDLFTYNANAQNNRNIALANSQAATRAAIASIAGSSIGASDRRLKENIVVVGKSPSGLEIVEFTYRNAPEVAPYLRGKRKRGVIADDVRRLRPDAVIHGSDGFLRVRYDKIDVRLEDITPETSNAERRTLNVERKAVKGGIPEGRDDYFERLARDQKEAA